jgi:putative hemolysin
MVAAATDAKPAEAQVGLSGSMLPIVTLLLFCISMLELFLLILVVLLLSGIFSGMEAAILSVTPSEVEVMVQKRKPFARLIQHVTEHINRSVTAVLIMNNIVNIAGSIFVGQKAVTIYGSAMLGIVTTAFTFGIILFSEIIPKSVAVRYARALSRLASPFIVVFSILFMPLIWPIEKLIHALFKGERSIGTEAQIRSLVRIGRRRGHIEQDEGQLIHRVFNLNDVKAKDIMTKRGSIVALPISMSIAKAAKKIIADPHSRFPVYRKTIDTIEGIILETEVLAGCAKGEDDVTLEYYARPALFVDENTRADDLLINFRNERAHMAIVQRKGKRIVGLVTLEDVLEELVGEIEDERDRKEVPSA